MPNLSYQARHSPPKKWEHLLAHATGSWVAVAGIGVGIQMIITLVTDFTVSRVAEILPVPFLLTLSVFLVGGGVVFLAGVFLHIEPLAKAQLLTRIGCIGLSVGWFTRALALISSTGVADGTSVWISLSLGAGCFTRLVASVLSEPIIDSDVKRKVRCRRHD